MEKVIVTKGLLNAIANAIKYKAGITKQLTLPEMAEAIYDLSSPEGTIEITSNGTVDVSDYASAHVQVTAEGYDLQSKTATPSETAQTITPDSGVYGLSKVEVGAISSSYVGSGIARKTSSDLTAAGATVTAPAGYYASAATKTVASGSAATPATAITANPSISVSAAGVITATVSESKSVTPTVNAGYVSSGTAGTVTVSGTNTAQMTTQAAKTVTPTKSEQTAVNSGVYTTGAIKVAAIPAQYITTTDATAEAADINAGETAYVNGVKVTGSQVIQRYYTGTADPSASQYNNGDLYLKVVS